MRVVVMGGTSGIGRVTAERFADEGAEVIVTGRDPEKLAAVKDRVASAEQVDGTDDDAVAAFLDRVGTIDHLVLAFSPGPVGVGPLADVPLADVRTAMDGKLVAYLGAIRHAQIRGSIAAGGSITMVSAASARAAMPGTAVLAAVNGAVERVVSPLAAELAPVRVNAVAPGVVDTPWWSFLPSDQRQDQFAGFAGMVPAGRVGEGDDVAGAIVYLAGASYVTGTVLPVDGGATVA